MHLRESLRKNKQNCPFAIGTLIDRYFWFGVFSFKTKCTGFLLFCLISSMNSAYIFSLHPNPSAEAKSGVRMEGPVCKENKASQENTNITKQKPQSSLAHLAPLDKALPVRSQCPAPSRPPRGKVQSEGAAIFLLRLYRHTGNTGQGLSHG